MKISKSEFEIQRHAHMHQAVPSAGKWEFCHLSVVTQAKNEVVTTFQRAKPLPFSVKQAKSTNKSPCSCQPFHISGL